MLRLHFHFRRALYAYLLVWEAPLLRKLKDKFIFVMEFNCWSESAQPLCFTLHIWLFICMKKERDRKKEIKTNLGVAVLQKSSVNVNKSIDIDNPSC